MKRFIAVLSGLLVLPAFADIARDTVQPIAQPSSITSRSGATGRGAARVSPSVRGSSDTSARNVNARTSATSRNATQARTGVKSREVATSPRTTATNNARVAQRTNISARSATKAAPVAATVRHNTTNNTTTNTGRVATANARTGVRSGITARAATVSANTTATDNTTTINQMDNLTQMTDYCKAQYTSCMDNYCNVLDDNQGRCTCSKNIKNYEKTEKALKEANEALQDAAQQIQYIGLTGDEIETLFSQTEAEIQMQAKTDNSQLKNSLDSIRDLIVEVKSGTATSTDTGMSFDLSGLLDFSIGDTGFDLSAIFGTNNTNTSSISNQRGEQLYKTASARCKASVLNTCQNQGVDISVITNAYDMEIDKQCIAYERSLNEANDNMNATVRNAKTVLQKARLMVAQQKNSYDLRGCINALDSCMQDEFVCGSDYENCLDPTGKYIVNGEIVMGSMPGLAVAGSSIDAPTSDLTQSGLYKTWNYDDGGTEVNAWNQDGSLAEYINATVKKNSKPSDTSSIMSEYLMAKIGYIDGNRTYGMCSAVLNKCRMHTFDTNDTYQFDNTVVKEYLARTMTKIKAAQDEILNDYAGNCMVDVETCLDKNNYGTTNGTYSNAAINACRSQIITCMSVNGDTTQDPNPAAIKAWIDSVYNSNSGNGGSGSGGAGNGSSGNGGSGNGGSGGSGGSGEGTPAEPEVTCMAINLIVNSETNETETVYKWTNSAAIYSDNICSKENQITNKTASKSGYTFDGYYTTNDLSGQQCVLDSGAVVFTDESIKNCNVSPWYAVWTANTPAEPEATCYKITLDPQGGTGGTQIVYRKSNDSSTWYSDNTCNTPTTITLPTKTGYDFIAYYNAPTTSSYRCTDDKGKIDTQYGSICTSNPTNITWYAQWKENTPAEPEVTCYKITLDPKGGTGGTTYIYKSNGTTLYSDSTCTTVLSTVTTPSNPGYTFDGYYNVSTYPYANCITANGGFSYDMTNCNPTSDTTWYAKYTATSCYKITLDKNGGTGGTEYVYKNTYKPTVLYADSQCTVSTTITYPTKTYYTFAGYVNNKSATTPVTCIEAGGHISTMTDCTPTSDTTWYATYSPLSFTVNFVLPTDYTVNYVSAPNTTATIGQTFKLPDSQNLTIVTPDTTYNIDNDCSKYPYWCYKSNSTGTSKCFYSNQNNSTNWMTATDVQDLYNSGKTMYFSLADTYDTCYELYETLGIQPIWHNDGYCYVTEIQEADIWCDAN